MPVALAAALGLAAGLATWFWRSLALPAQLTLLTLAPLVALAGVELASRRTYSRAFAVAFALSACGAAWAALVVAPRALDLPFSSLLLWPGIGFGMALGTSYGFRAVLAASFVALVVAAASVFFVSAGTPWTLVFERLEPLAISAFVLAASAGWLVPAGPAVADTARVTGLALGYVGLLALSTIRGMSLLPVAPETALVAYRLVTAATAAAALRRFWWARRTGPSWEAIAATAEGGDAGRISVAALVFVVSMGGLLGVARWNRGGEPQFIVLTERELAWPAGRLAASGGVRLEFRWEARDSALDAKVWLPDGRLNALGFRTDVVAGAPEAGLFYARSLPRNAWVAFELDGPAWAVIEQRRAMAVVGRGGMTSPPPSRLVPVDAGPDPGALRRRYADQRVVVLPAVIEMRHASDPMRGSSVWGRIAGLASPDVSVPSHLRARLAMPPAPSSYEVVLGVGRLGAVWVQDIRSRVR